MNSKQLLIIPLLFIILLISCNNNLEKLSVEYKTEKTIKSLRKLSNALEIGMTSEDIEKLFGTPDQFIKEERRYTYITHERTKMGDSFYVLEIRFNENKRLSNYILSIADE